MKIVISVPDADLERFDRIAERQGMTSSEFYRVAGGKLADELEGAGAAEQSGTAELTRLADAAIIEVGQPTAGEDFLRESERIARTGSEW
ncbi:ribbon-helix-helix protein, CopG family [Clavibacter michiganensis]|uniref:ribbon-helix-helix protein, CopG family n=1 Tax=Clavibacter michiganensis TaxID=28447 RepID=UPI000A3AB1DF|nr:ribbon-helix-helix protein, CopG family [Clavibacter michiganensis]